jgi:hypothetical protein
MVTATVTPEHGLALASAASRHAPAAHAPGPVVIWLAVIGFAAACWLAYRVSLWLHPFTLCRRCAGSGRVGTVPAMTARSPIQAARAGSRPGTAARCRQPARPGPCPCPVPVRRGTVPLPAAGSRPAGMAPGAGG